jgi:hypothetical protein
VLEISECKMRKKPKFERAFIEMAFQLSDVIFLIFFCINHLITGF